VLEEPAVLPGGKPITFTCGGVTIGSALLSESAEAFFSIPVSKTHVGILECTASYSGKSGNIPGCV
jgi:hypothetical protein